jgi:pimeloyl-ACP methyl ester carboxylesterase
MNGSILLIVFCFFVCYNVQSQSIDTLIDVGGYRLHFNILQGNGVPILFESGGGDDGSVWRKLLNPLHDSTGATLITYDRAGLGKSEIDTSNINILNEVKGLETGLSRLGYTNSLFLVSHSLGGSYSILFASRNSKDITGVVFIDINLACFITQQKAKEIKESFSSKMDRFKTERIGVYYSLINIEQTTELMQQTPFPAHIPATVIGADFALYEGSDGTKWKECIRNFGMQPNHSYVFAKDCGHYVFRDNPELVINEIVKLYRQVSVK